MSDFSVPNSKPGECAKCRGKGTYSWGAMVNGKMTHTGQCHSCRGKGHQTAEDIRRNTYYNSKKIVSL